VISVAPLADNASKHWLPPWPPSTIVVDQINKESFQVPAGPTD
jgi:hypothetical protein